MILGKAWDLYGWNAEITNDAIRNCHIKRFREQNE